MGTRSATGFIHKEKYTGVYNHFDGYYEGVGHDVVETLRTLLAPAKGTKNKKESTKRKLALLKRRLIALKPVSNGAPPTAEEQVMYQQAGFSNLSVSTQLSTDWYCLLRNLQGADWITAAYKGKLFHILDGSEFPKDSLFCEYAYVINFDANKFEVYDGFQQAPQEGNIFGTEANDGGYYPCAKVMEFPLTRIPKNWIEKVSELDKEEA